MPQEWPKAIKKFMRRYFITAVVLILVILLAGFILAWQQVNFLLSPVSAEKKQVQINIPQGAAAGIIGTQLENAGIIRSGLAFRLYVAYNKQGALLRAGEHLLDPGLSTPAVIDHIIKGRMKMYRVTVPEGLTMTQTAKVLASSGLVEEGRLLKLFKDPELVGLIGQKEGSPEGYLYPETYFFTAGISARDMVRAMLNRFEKVWAKYAHLTGRINMSRHEIITLASIIEKETGASQERPLIAAVFLNRLKKRMRLQSDPTVIYGLKDFNGNLTRKHLETYSPYNTYMIKGLPPGPVASPGEESIKAVFFPADVTFLYFVAKNDGTHHFSSNLAAHNRAVNLYQKRRRRH